MGIGLLPRPEVLLEAIISFNEKTVSASAVGTLLRIWPAETDVFDLAKEELGENEVWDKGEAYFIKILEPASLRDRLDVW